MTSKRFLLAALLIVILGGCANIELPPGQEDRREFVQDTPLSFREAYQIVAKQMRACYRVIGLFGNGYDIQADLDTADSLGRIELYHVGITGASKAEDSIFSRTVTIKARDNGSVVTTAGTTPKYVYANHLAIASWLRGSDACGTGGHSPR